MQAGQRIDQPLAIGNPTLCAITVDNDDQADMKVVVANPAERVHHDGLAGGIGVAIAPSIHESNLVLFAVEELGLHGDRIGSTRRTSDHATTQIVN
jgi:hypothetical protein